MSYLDKLKNQHYKLEKEIMSLQNFINRCPDGQLICRQRGNGRMEFSVKKKDESGVQKEIYLGQPQHSLAETLAKKEYALACLKDRQNELWFVKQQIAHMEREDKAELLLKKHPGIAQLVLPSLKKQDNFVKEWKESDYKRSDLNPEHLIVTTILPDLLVRSKSESSLVTLFETNGVPFRYEEEHVINGVRLHPDFTCLNPRTHEIFYWEHHGRVDDPKYVKEQQWREEQYRQAGIFPWINLLITTETEGNPLNMQWAESIIKHYLI